MPMPSSSIYQKGKEATSVAASMMLLRHLDNKLLRYDLLSSGITCLRSRLPWRYTIAIEQDDGLHTNNVFYAVKTYLDSRMEAVGTTNAMSSGSMDDKDTDKLVMGEKMVDVYEGAEFRWCLCTHHHLLGRGSGKLYFELTFHKKHKKKALGEYLPFIVATTKAIRNKEAALTIYMNDGSEWTPMDLYKTSTFASLPMDHTLKQSVIDDLDKFINRKARCKKRGYLLYGPPGTGKSSLLAAMANHLSFDIYDLVLTGVETNSQLRKLLLGMTNQSILVIEDMNFTTELKQRDDKKKILSNSDSGKDEKVTILSRLLNIIDRLWSTTGEERILVFKTSYKEGLALDPALLRPGRMDMHVHMGYCIIETFRIFLNNYHSVYNLATYSDHSIYDLGIEELTAEIEELMPKVAVTPEEVAKTLADSLTTRMALLDIIKLLKSKKERANKEEEEDGDDDKMEDDDDPKKEGNDDDSRDNGDDDDNEK